ncbi:MAG: hypothetical protein NAG76_09365 [Candidatus Pristimantibacillus lignocellulolyticus]|uniref:Uncharacterized protein n=1 Tax=Candidatus Pristimantibacillus lignocellulolyticus TaxID=2994561 RepID=A0A9J6ZJI1_9BACL|nr:MAG: hypothetical protein NAG76_09365 [Candidatus Pristimantibacillus lignocellulolyticus]
MSTKSKFLRKYEHTVYRMAMILLNDDKKAIEVCKRVLCQLWHDDEFCSMDERKQHNRMIWLVSCAS